MMHIVINNTHLMGINMSEVWSYPHVNHSDSLEAHGNWSGASGHQHYRLLTHLSYQFNGVRVADVGTSTGGSAFALAANQKNEVYSLDRTACRPSTPVGNVTFTVGDFHEKEIMDEVVKASLILLDIQHEGTDEHYFYDELVRRNWQGVLLVDDIRLNVAMEIFWSTIKHRKYDISTHGSRAGTGLVSFNNTTIELQ